MNLISKRIPVKVAYVALFILFLMAWWKYLYYIQKHWKRNKTEHNYITCEDFKEISTSAVIGEGWTTVVYKGMWGKTPLAVKMVNEKGQAMKQCRHSYWQCLEYLNQDLGEEVKIFQELFHPNIVKFYGSCFSHSISEPVSKGVLLVELGNPLQSFTLVQRNFKERLKFAKDLASLLLYLGNSTPGGLLLPDFRLQQFVTVGEILKLSDVDGIEFYSEKCVTDSDCIQAIDGNEGTTFHVPCKEGNCFGLNDRLNVWKACRNILPYLVSFGAPKAIENLAKDVLECQKGSWSSSKLDSFIQNLTEASATY